MRWTLATALAVVCAMVAQPAQASFKLLFFDPDANQDRLLTIVELFNNYIEEKSTALEFEPVQTLDAFNSRVLSRDAKFAIVSSSYLQPDNPVHLEPLLVPELNGSIYFRKELVIIGPQNKRSLRGKTVAVTVADSRAADVLAQLRSLGVDVEGAFVVSVSKDVDALLAVSFGQADAALVTAESLKVLEQLNPKVWAQLQIAIKTGNSLRSPLCEVNGHASSGERKEMLQLIDGLTKNAQGRQLLQALSMSGWVKYDPGSMK